MRWIIRGTRFAASLVYRTTRLAVRVRSVAESERPRFRAREQREACARFLEHLGVTVRVEGEIPARHEYLIASNHVGFLDPWVIASVMDATFAAKTEMASWPVMGWVCRTVGIIFVDRDRRAATSNLVDAVRESMRGGVPGATDANIFYGVIGA